MDESPYVLLAEEVTVLDKCLGVVNLSLTGNRLTALGGHIRYCRQLWRLILARNQVSHTPTGRVPSRKPW
jgi:hypothetical protein